MFDTLMKLDKDREYTVIIIYVQIVLNKNVQMLL